MKRDFLRVFIMANAIAYWITWFVGSISYIAMHPSCYGSARNQTLVDCIADMPLWFGWLWRAVYGWLG